MSGDMHILSSNGNKDILLKNLRQFGSQYALDLLQYGRDYMIENDEEYQKKYNNKIK